LHPKRELTSRISLQRAMRSQPQHPLSEKLHALLLQIDKLPKVPS
jgi:hypothetical protein